MICLSKMAFLQLLGLSLLCLSHAYGSDHLNCEVAKKEMISKLDVSEEIKNNLNHGMIFKDDKTLHLSKPNIAINKEGFDSVVGLPTCSFDLREGFELNFFCSSSNLDGLYVENINELKYYGEYHGLNYERYCTKTATQNIFFIHQRKYEAYDEPRPAY